MGEGGHTHSLKLALSHPIHHGSLMPTVWSEMTRVCLFFRELHTECKEDRNPLEQCETELQLSPSVSLWGQWLDTNTNKTVHVNPFALLSKICYLPVLCPDCYIWPSSAKNMLWQNNVFLFQNTLQACSTSLWCQMEHVYTFSDSFDVFRLFPTHFFTVRCWKLLAYFQKWLGQHVRQQEICLGWKY
jgi:hypothetical protein